MADVGQVRGTGFNVNFARDARCSSAVCGHTSTYLRLVGYDRSPKKCPRTSLWVICKYRERLCCGADTVSATMCVVRRYLAPVAIALSAKFSGLLIIYIRAFSKFQHGNVPQATKIWRLLAWLPFTSAPSATTLACSYARILSFASFRLPVCIHIVYVDGRTCAHKNCTAVETILCSSSIYRSRAATETETAVGTVVVYAAATAG